MPSPSLQTIIEEIGADSAAIMVPNVKEGHLFCFDSVNMPQEWIDIKNRLSEKVVGGNVEVYKSGKPAITNHHRIMLKGFYIESVMITPIKRGEKTVATLELIHDKDNKVFIEKDLHKAKSFAKKLEIRLLQ